MKMIFTCILFISNLLFASDYVPVPIKGLTMHCFEGNSSKQWSYCINKIEGSQSKDIIYYFHGRNGNATWWNDKTYYTGKMHNLWLEKSKDIPTVVSISFGKLWLLTNVNDESQKNFEKIFTEEIIKKVESQLDFKVSKRMVVGESMGGVNSMMIALKTKTLFHKAASVCAAMPTTSPFSSWKEIYDYVLRSSTSVKRALMMLWFAKKFYPNEKDWQANDPVQLSYKVDSSLKTSIYLSCGEKDEWGCMEGSKIFVDNLSKAKADIHWYPRPGGHCDIDHESLAGFLVE